jgi:hypothetical protein
MTPSTQPNQRIQPMRVNPARRNTPLNMMHISHLRCTTELTHPITTLMHLNPALPINSVTLPTPIRHRPHSSSSAIASFNSSKSTDTISATSRIDRLVPPARSHPIITGTNSGGHNARD